MHYYCPNCGNDFVEGSSICFKCGAKLDGNSTQVELNSNITDKSNTINNTVNNNINNNDNDDKTINDTFLSNMFRLKNTKRIPLLKLIENKESFLQHNDIYINSHIKTAKYTIMLYLIFFLIVLILKIKVLDFFIWMLPLLYFISTGLANCIDGIIIGIKSFIITKQSESLRCIFINLLVIVATILYLYLSEYIVESFY